MIWLIIHTPDGVHAWPVCEDDETPDESLIHAARVAVGYPAEDVAVRDDGWDISLAPGQPHNDLQATVGSVAALRLVDAAAVAEHVQGRAEFARQSTVDAVKTLLAGLDDDILSAVLADPAVAARSTKGG